MNVCTSDDPWDKTLLIRSLRVRVLQSRRLRSPWWPMLGFDKTTKNCIVWNYRQRTLIHPYVKNHSLGKSWKEQKCWWKKAVQVEFGCRKGVKSKWAIGSVMLKWALLFSIRPVVVVASRRPGIQSHGFPFATGHRYRLASYGLSLLQLSDMWIRALTKIHLYHTKKVLLCYR